MISVLIPTYNYSVVNLVSQIYQQAIKAKVIFEIIIADDASTDVHIKNENKKIIKQLKHCRLIENNLNLGRTETRNLLAINANFDWLLFLDADVIPKYDDFLKRFINNCKQYELLFGGIEYEKKQPSEDKILRWKYGNKREFIPYKKRKLDCYHTINSGCFFLKKDLFISFNKELSTNQYGLDILFKQLLKDKKVKVLHIDNPVFHLGLEKNIDFLKKSLEAVNTTVRLEEEGKIRKDLRPLQKSFLRLNKLRITSSFYYFTSKFKEKMKRNFLSKNPNLFWFDVYRLNYYIELKLKKKNA